MKTHSFGKRNTDRSLEEQLSELGELIWRAIQSDDEISERLFELADAKLSRDNVSDEYTRLDPNDAAAIMGYDCGTEALEERRARVTPSGWLKYSLFNFALDWVLDQALMRMKMEQKWPFQQEDGFSKP